MIRSGKLNVENDLYLEVKNSNKYSDITINQ